MQRMRFVKKRVENKANVLKNAIYVQYYAKTATLKKDCGSFFGWYR